jgi:hypothetical protein
MIPEIFDFNRRCLNVASKDVPQLEFKHAAFCVKAIREEAKELEDEHLDRPVVEGGDRIEIVWTDPQSEEARWQTVRSVDAGIDAAYFAVGLMARAGLTEDQALACFKAVHDANMTKKLGVVAGRGDMGVADAAKPIDFVPPDQQIYAILFGRLPNRNEFDSNRGT